MLAELLVEPFSIIESVGLIGCILGGGAVVREYLWWWRLTRSALGYRQADRGAESDRRFRNLGENLVATLRNSTNRQFKKGGLNKEEYTVLLKELDALRDTILHSPRGETWSAHFFTKRKLLKQDYWVITHLENAVNSLAEEPDSMFDLCYKSILEASEALNKRGLLVVHTGK